MCCKVQIKITSRLLTLILVIHKAPYPKTVWLLKDRRLEYSGFFMFLLQRPCKYLSTTETRSSLNIRIKERTRETAS